MKVLICGDRWWTDRDKIHSRLIKLFEYTNLIFITGACRGADQVAESVIREMGVGLITMPADWNKYGSSAGPIRNREMLDMKPDLVIAFHSNIKISNGTTDCIFEANRRGIPVEIIP